MNTFFVNKINKFVNLPKTVKLISCLFKKFFLTSVDFFQIYHYKFNIIRYLICVLHFILINFGLLIFLLIAINDSAYNLINNTLLPANFRFILLFLLSFLILSICVRLDILINEWNHRLRVLKFLYHFLGDDKKSIGLKRKNYEKLSILLKFIELIFLKGFALLICFLLTFLFLLIAIKSNNFAFQLLTPLILYLVLMTASTLALIVSLGFLAFYYYKLLFDQINDQFKRIYKRSSKIISLKDQMRLIKLIGMHNQRAKQIEQMNEFVRRTLLLLFIFLAFVQTIPLHLYIESDQLIYQIIFLVFLLIAMIFGFGVVFVLSMQIRSAHKPSKMIYCVFNRKLHLHKINLYFKFKVILLYSIVRIYKMFLIKVKFCVLILLIF